MLALSFRSRDADGYALHHPESLATTEPVDIELAFVARSVRIVVAVGHPHAARHIARRGMAGIAGADQHLPHAAAARSPCRCRKATSTPLPLPGGQPHRSRDLVAGPALFEKPDYDAALQGEYGRAVLVVGRHD